MIDISEPLFSDLGLTIAGLDEFITACGGEGCLSGLTTTEVCERFTKPHTQHYKASYCSLLHSEGNSKVSTATILICHSWSYIFLDMVAAVRYHANEMPGAVLWIDLFSSNQHKHFLSLNVETWLGMFRDAISRFGETMLVLLTPWREGEVLAPLTRSWCLFEIYLTMEVRGNFQVAIDPYKQREFIKMLQSNFKVVSQLIANFDSAKGVSTIPEEGAKVLELIKTTVGFDNLNIMIFEMLRDWLAGVIEGALASNFPDKNTLGLKNSLGQLLQDQGRVDEAEKLYLDCYILQLEQLGPDHPQTLDTMDLLADLYTDLQKFEKAETLYNECLKYREKRSGPQDLETLNTVINLAYLYQIQCKYMQAEPLCRRALEVRTAILGEAHTHTLNSMNNLAYIYEAQGKFALAQPLYLRCWEHKKAKLGEKHPECLTVMGELANLYQLQGNYSDAESTFKEIIEIKKKVHEQVHPDTLNSLNSLACLYDAQVIQLLNFISANVNHNFDSRAILLKLKPLTRNALLRDELC